MKYGGKICKCLMSVLLTGYKSHLSFRVILYQLSSSTKLWQATDLASLTRLGVEMTG